MRIVDVSSLTNLRSRSISTESAAETLPPRIFGRAHRCIRRFAHCKFAAGRRYRPSLTLNRPSLRSRWNRTPSKPMAALWMAGWLALMLVMVVAGREAMRELNVFQLMEMRSVLGFCLLYPVDPPQWRLCDDEDRAAAAAYRAQPDPLRRAARLVLRADADPDRPGGGDRIHHADLDRDPGRDAFSASA